MEEEKATEGIKQIIRDTYTRSTTSKSEFYKNVFDLIISLFDGANYKEVEEFAEYIKEMAKLSSNPKPSFDAIRGLEYTPFYETNIEKVYTILKDI